MSGLRWQGHGPEQIAVPDQALCAMRRARRCDAHQARAAVGQGESAGGV